MKLFIYVFKKFPRLAIIALGSALVGGLANAAVIRLVHKALQNWESSTSIAAIGWQYFGLTLTAIAASVISQIILSRLYRKIVYDWQVYLSKSILNLPIRRLEEIGTKTVLATLTKDVTALGSALMPMLPLINHLIVVSVCLGYLYFLSWQLFVGVVVCLALGGLSYQTVLVRGKGSLREAREELQELYGHFQSMTDGAKELKLHTKRTVDFFDTMLQPSAAVVERRFFRWSILNTCTSAWGKFLVLFVIGVVLFVVPSIAQVNSQELTGYVLILLYIRSILLSLMGIVPSIYQADVALEKIEELGIEFKPEVLGNDLEIPEPIDESWSSIEIKNATHSYYREREEDNFELGPINIRFLPGEIVFLVGGNGSGKTTLAKMIVGLYVPESGDIQFSGTKINDRNRNWYRQHFSVVFSDFYLFKKFIGLNTDGLKDRVEYYLQKLQIDHKVKFEGDQLSTTDLSRGQRQRLALLIAYLEDRPFYVFDEWAANQDPVFKAIFYKELLPELKSRGKTVLVISHDDKYFHLGDRILKLDYGKLTEDSSNTDPSMTILAANK